MKIINKEESEKFYSSLPVEIADIFRNKIKLVYIEDQSLFWKSSASAEDILILAEHNTAIKNQLRIIFNCGSIQKLTQSEEQVSFLIEAIKLLQVKEIKFSK